MPEKLRDAFDRPKSAPVSLGRPPPASLESDKAYVKSLYRELLGREPDPEGFYSHMKGLENGMSRDELRNVFLSSPEYQQLQTKPAEPPAPPVAPVAPKPNTTAEFQSYFADLVQKSGVGPIASPQALAAIEPQLKEAGVELQRNSAGEIRGRLYLPVPPGADRYGRAVDIGSFGEPWKWVVR